MEFKECKKCVNNSLNPSISFNKKRLCNICQAYQKNFSKKILEKEKKFLKKLKENEYDVMVGISGGKDSTATLYTIKKIGLKALAFTFDIGYYPEHIFKRSKQIAKQIGFNHEIINIRKYIRKIDLKCYKKTVELYEKGSKEDFIKIYKEGRKHYSIKCKHVIPFVRTCQLCRRTVIRAYYHEAIKHKVKAIILGINEWAGLSKNKIKSIRKLKPYKNKPAVYIIHLPFMLQRNVKDTEKILKKIGWKKPKKEKLVESNSNSCLFALATEEKAKKILGFHPDTTRLAREVTAGFLTKEQAKKALNKKHKTKLKIRKVLEKAGIL